jgi:hypothetical protein
MKQFMNCWAQIFFCLYTNRMMQEANLKDSHFFQWEREYLHNYNIEVTRNSLGFLELGF